MENLNAVFINDGVAQFKRLIKLNQIAIHQMRTLEDTGDRKLLKEYELTIQYIFGRRLQKCKPNSPCTHGRLART